MPKQKRFSTKYPGVFFIVSGDDRTYYIVYRRHGEKKLVEEKAIIPGKTMTPALANQLRAERIRGKELSNKEKRQAAIRAEKAAKEKMTVTRLWGLYRENLEGLKSRAADTSRFENYIKPAFGNKEPHEILPLDIDRLRRKALAGKSDQTIKHVLALLRRIVRYGVKKQVARPLSFVLETPTVDNQVIETLNQDELKRLIKVLDESTDTQVSHIMKLGLFTGMRKGELLKLKWSDIDYDGGLILIRHPKGKKSMHIPMNGEARSILKSHPRVKDKERSALEGRICFCENVFANDRGKPFADIRKRVEIIRKAAGLPKGFRPIHGLRHVYASLLASSGKVDIYTLQRLLTHKSTSTTQRYAHLMNEVLQKASQAVVDAVEAVKNGD